MEIKKISRISAWSLALALFCVISFQSGFGQSVSTSEVFSQERVALIIANSNYLHLPVIPPAIAEARRFRSALLQTGFREDRIIHLENAVRARMLDALRELGSLIKDDGLFVIYFVGHTATVDQRNYLLFADYQNDPETPIQSRSVSLTRLLSAGGELTHLKRLLILDSAYSAPQLVAESHGAGIFPVEVKASDSILYSIAPGHVQDLPLTDEVRPFSAALSEVWISNEQGLRSGLQDKLRRMLVSKVPNMALPKLDSQWLDDPSWLPNRKSEIAGRPSNAPAPPLPGELRENSKDGLKYAYIPPGKFRMGCVPSKKDCSKEEWPQHEVEITRGFWIGMTEVTVVAYRRFAGSAGMPPRTQTNPDFKNTQDPISRVSLAQAQSFCQWAGGGRVPTEAEWEYAARGGKQDFLFPWGNEISRDQANYEGTDKRGIDKYEQTSPVGTFEDSKNGWNLQDVVGNLAEWVADDYAVPQATEGVSKDPVVKNPASKKSLVKGGSFFAKERELLLSARKEALPGPANWIGFRCLLPAWPEETSK